MTAATLTGMSLETRLQQVIALAISGTYEAGICVCGEDNCSCIEDIRKVLDVALRAVDRAPRGGGAVAIYMECWAKLTGIPESEWSVGITRGGES